MTDASSSAVGAVLQQYIEHKWCPIAYFSKKLKPSERKYSTFDRELLAIYLAIKHFRYFIEGREFQILTDHKPLTYSLSSNSDHYTPHQIRHISRAGVHALTTPPPVINFTEIAAAQQEDSEIKQFQGPDYFLSKHYLYQPPRQPYFMMCQQVLHVYMSLHNSGD